MLGLVYNLHPVEHPLIVEDSQRVFRQYLRRFGYPETIVTIPAVDIEKPIPEIDFSTLFIGMEYANLTGFENL